MSRSGGTALVLASFVALVACGGGGDQQAQTKTGEEQAAAGQQSQARKQAQRGPGAVTVSLSPKNDSGITGEAKIRRSGESIRVALLLRGLRPEGSYPAHIHKGTCKAGGGVATGLSSVSSNRSKMGTSQTTIDATALSPDSSYFLQAHLPDGTPAACGNIPMEALGSSGGM